MQFAGWLGFRMGSAYGRQRRVWIPQLNKELLHHRLNEAEARLIARGSERRYRRAFCRLASL